MTRCQELARVGSAALGAACTPVIPLLQGGRLAIQLGDLLRLKNGFYAFESALHVLPAGSTGGLIDVNLWNEPATWKNAYGGLADGLLCFAADIFGGQFCLADDGVYAFDPETGSRERISPDIEGWADCILTDYNYLTGYPLAHEWQKARGALPQGQRLVPKVPFVCGGPFEIGNLCPMDAIEAMCVRGELARQLKGVSDGASIAFRAIENSAKRSEDTHGA